MDGPARSTAASDAPTDTPLGLAAAGALPVDEVLERLGSTASGLDEAEAARRLQRVGPNVLPTRSVTAFGVLLRQVRNPLLILLLAAAGISAATGSTTDGGIIAAIVLLSVGLGFVNEYRSELAVAALHANIHHVAVVWRDGVQRQLDVRDVVPGDVLELHVGDLVPADLRLLDVVELECDEGVLTGESATAAKTAVPSTTDSAVDLPSCAFMGTVVHQGSARGVVVATGSATAFGAIPSDSVDAEVLARPAAWDIAFVRRFMSIFGPISSIFDFATFFVMLSVLHASHDEFRSGWFVESLATQTLVVFLIRTRRIPFFRSRPSLPMLVTPLVCAAIGAYLPFSPLAGVLGFATLPLSFFLILLGMIVVYLLLVEGAKHRFYAAQAHPHRPALTHGQRHTRRVARRAARYVHRH